MNVIVIMLVASLVSLIETVNFKVEDLMCPPMQPIVIYYRQEDVCTYIVPKRTGTIDDFIRTHCITPAPNDTSILYNVYQPELRELASSAGARLVRIKTQEKLQHLRETQFKLLQHKTKLLLDLYFIGRRWKWGDGEIATFTDWLNENEAVSTTHGKTCAAIDMEKNFKWVSVSCNNPLLEYQAICEIPNVNKCLQPDNGGCPSGQSCGVRDMEIVCGLQQTAQAAKENDTNANSNTIYDWSKPMTYNITFVFDWLLIICLSLTISAMVSRRYIEKAVVAENKEDEDGDEE